MPRKKLNDQQRRQLRESYAAGAGLSTVCGELGIGWRTASTALREMGIDIRPPGRQPLQPVELTDDDRQAVIALYQSGHTAGSIARRYQVTSVRVIAELRQAGVYQPRRAPSDDDRRTMQEMYGHGCTAREIGLHLGVSHQCVLDSLRRLGVDIRPLGARPGAAKRQYSRRSR